MKRGSGSWLLLLACLAGGGAMIFFGLKKAVDPVAFLKAVHEYGILPESAPRLLNLVAVALPAVEILGGLLLVLGIWRRAVAGTLALMLLLFTAAVLQRALGLHAEAGGPFCAVAFDCGCGTGVVRICAKLLENGFLILCCAWAALDRRDRPFALGRGWWS
ncbi:MAG: DoxX family membrane protein [Planctomycetota bacterium]|nr:MAG: DoxX family membrane protein [Planctomycetota bacterium]